MEATSHNIRRRFSSFLTLLLVFGAASLTSLTASHAEPIERFTVKEGSLFIDLDKPYYEGSEVVEGNNTDYKIVGELLFHHSEIKVAFLTGQGGFVYSADRIARSFMRHGITTVAYGECLSACAYMFLGGVERRLAQGGILGLHRAQASVADHRSFYAEMKETRGWADEFSYAEWNYQDGQLLAKNTLEIVLEQGIDPEVLINMFSVGPDDVWRPLPKELEELKIVTNIDPYHGDNIKTNQ